MYRHSLWHISTKHTNASFCVPLQGFTFYLAIINNIFSICGLAGVLNAHRELVIAFFAFNAAQMVFSFHFFVDMVADARE